jgi:hypothetical protein
MSEKKDSDQGRILLISLIVLIFGQYNQEENKSYSVLMIFLVGKECEF